MASFNDRFFFTDVFTVSQRRRAILRKGLSTVIRGEMRVLFEIYIGKGVTGKACHDAFAADRYYDGDSFNYFSVTQAGDNHHFHPTCARCTKCGDPFGDGEEMYLQGERTIFWYSNVSLSCAT